MSRAFITAVLSYVLPTRSTVAMPAELGAYVATLSSWVQVIVVDGSDAAVFWSNRRRLAALGHVMHVPPDPDVRQWSNGKVSGVITGLRRASHEHVVIADDDVRYDLAALRAIARELNDADVVRPQNYFDPLPWHARLDTARTLLNRISGGDWPGTLGVRRSKLLSKGGYDGDVLFENFELVQTITAAGGKESVPASLYVRRLPPRARHFWSQRVRQAYDELARPRRLVVWLSVLPALSIVSIAGAWQLLTLGACATILLADIGRRRSGGARVFPATAALLAPVWVIERGLCAWAALGCRLLLGGIPYHGRIVSRAATPYAVLERRLKEH